MAYYTQLDQFYELMNLLFQGFNQFAGNYETAFILAFPFAVAFALGFIGIIFKVVRNA